MTNVTVKAGATLTLAVGGFKRVYVAGDALGVPTFEVARLRRDGAIV